MRKEILIILMVIFAFTSYCYPKVDTVTKELSTKETNNLFNVIYNSIDSITYYNNCFNTESYEYDWLVYIHEQNSKIIFSISPYPINPETVKNIRLVGYRKNNSTISIIGIDSTIKLSECKKIQTYKMDSVIESIHYHDIQYCKNEGIVTILYYYIFELNTNQLHKKNAHVDYDFYNKYIDIPSNKKGVLLPYTSQIKNYKYIENNKGKQNFFLFCRYYYMFTPEQKEKIFSGSWKYRNIE